MKNIEINKNEALDLYNLNMSEFYDIENQIKILDSKRDKIQQKIKKDVIKTLPDLRTQLVYYFFKKNIYSKDNGYKMIISNIEVYPYELKRRKSIRVCPKNDYRYFSVSPEDQFNQNYSRSFDIGEYINQYTSLYNFLISKNKQKPIKNISVRDLYLICGSWMVDFSYDVFLMINHYKEYDKEKFDIEVKEVENEKTVAKAIKLLGKK